MSDAERLDLREEQEPSSRDARFLALAQQGFTSIEIADLFGIPAREIDVAIAALVPGGFPAVRRALRQRLRAWQRATRGAGWDEAEEIFGIPHANIARLVRAPEDGGVQSPGAQPNQPGYLDVVLLGLDELDERERICARAYAMGATLQELGDRFGVTRERIRQILHRNTPWSTADIRARLRALEEIRQDENRRAVRDWSLENPGAEIADGVAALGMPSHSIVHHLGRRRRMHVPRRTGGHAPLRRTDEEILDDIRRYVEQTGRTTGSGFSEWAKENGVPGKQTAAMRHGNWNAALRAAGVADRASQNRERTHSLEDLWAAVIAALRSTPHGGTFREYESWQMAHPAAPSGALVRQRLNLTWAEIQATALEVIRGDSEADPEWITEVTAARSWDSCPEKVDDTSHVHDAIADIGTRVTIAEYSQWARAHSRPTAATLMRRTGKGWGTLVEEAGGEAPRLKLRGVDRDGCVAHLQKFISAHPSARSTAYPQWARENGAPSISTVAARFGTWSDAVAIARAEHGGASESS